VGVKRGRGRPAVEPELLPAGEAYDAWRDRMEPRIEALLVKLEADERNQTKLETLLDAACVMRDHDPDADEVPASALALASVLPLLKMSPTVTAGAREYRSAYQVWIEIACRVLRAVDVGAIVRRVHPERFAMRAVESDRPHITDTQLQRDQDGDAIQQQRKRMRISDEESRALVSQFWSAYVADELPD